MGYSVKLTSSSQIVDYLGKLSTASAGKVLFSRYIYKTLGSLIKSKTILADYEAKTLPAEYIRFLDRMEEINLDTADLDVIATDEVLGDLGVLLEYSYSKDGVNISSWMAGLEAYIGYRNVVSGIDNVVYGEENVIYVQGGTDG